MKTQIFACLVAAALPLTVNAQTPHFKAGEYTATAEGIHGPVEVKVTFSNNAIKDIRILKQTETEGIGTVAATELPKKLSTLNRQKSTALPALP